LLEPSIQTKKGQKEPQVMKRATVYDICDKPVLGIKNSKEPGSNLRKLYKKLFCNPFLKYFILRWCGHPSILNNSKEKYVQMMSAAMQATHENWQDKNWIETTFAPLAELLDKVQEPEWRVRAPIKKDRVNLSDTQIEKILSESLNDIFRVWKILFLLHAPSLSRADFY
jgi:hypothetical protein